MKNKKRVIIVTLVMAVIIMALIVVIIVAATSRIKGSETATVVSSGTIALDQPEKDVAGENLGPVSNEGNSGTVQSEPIIITVPEPEITEESSLPATGPLDFLPIALIFGALTTYLASLKLAKSEA